jgi:hypothetical protein
LHDYPAGAIILNGMGNEVLAGARFPHNHHGVVAIRHLADGVEYLASYLTLAYHVGKAFLGKALTLLQLSFKLKIFPFQPHNYLLNREAKNVNLI